MNKKVLTEKTNNLTVAVGEPRVKLLQRQLVQRDVADSSSFTVPLNERLLGTAVAGFTALTPLEEERACEVCTACTCRAMGVQRASAPWLGCPCVLLGAVRQSLHRRATQRVAVPRTAALFGFPYASGVHGVFVGAIFHKPCGG